MKQLSVYISIAIFGKDVRFNALSGLSFDIESNYFITKEDGEEG